MIKEKTPKKVKSARKKRVAAKKQAENTIIENLQQSLKSRVNTEIFSILSRL